MSKLGGGGGVEVIWTKSKRTTTFFRETLPKYAINYYYDFLFLPLLLNLMSYMIFIKSHFGC